MRIMIDNSELKRYVPNVLREAAGEPAFIDKLTAFLNQSERWVAELFTGDALLDDAADANLNELRELILPVVIDDAMTNALPSLDLVLTPNGFGIVSNQNIAPASKERVERLAQSLVKNRDIAICQLFTKLARLEDWHSTEQCRWFAEVFLSDPVDTEYYAGEKGVWMSYLELRPEMRRIENWIADKFLGQEYMQELRDKQIGIQTRSNQDIPVMAAVKQTVLEGLKRGVMVGGGLVYAVNIIRDNPDAYPTWHGSLIAQVYGHETFKNKKRSNGYFF